MAKDQKPSWKKEHPVLFLSNSVEQDEHMDIVEQNKDQLETMQGQLHEVSDICRSKIIKITLQPAVFHSRLFFQ